MQRHFFPKARYIVGVLAIICFAAMADVTPAAESTATKKDEAASAANEKAPAKKDVPPAAAEAKAAVKKDAPPPVADEKPAAKKDAPPVAAERKAAAKKEVPSAAAGEQAAAKEKSPPTTPGKLRINFRFQPWKDVLDWFAQQAGLSLVMDNAPRGTFNYTGDNREYTPAEAIDILNSVLLTKGYTLVRRDRMLMLINLEDPIPPGLISNIPLEDLDNRGEYELVSVLFNLETLKPEEAESEVRKLLGPQGSVVTLSKSRQLMVTETAGRLRAIRSVLKRIESPDGSSSASVQTFALKNARPENVLPILRQLLEIPEDKAVANDGSVRIAAEAGSSRLVVSGRPEKVARAAELLKKLDVSPPGGEAEGGDGPAKLEVYPITGADPQSVLSVLQLMLNGQPDVRMVVDAKSNNLVAMAHPPQHATIRATLAQLQQDSQRVEVIRLSRVDPQTAVLSINKLFGSDSGKGPAPQIDADPSSRQLMIRGTEAQIAQVRDLLQKLGENLSPAGSPMQSGNVRMLPLSSRAARSALDRLQDIWPSMRQNKIRIVAPSAAIPSIRTHGDEGSGETPAELLQRLREAKPPFDKPATVPPQESPQEATPGEASSALPADHRSSEMPFGARTLLVAQQQPDEAAAAPGKPTSAEPAPIIVVPSAGGLLIASEDTAALDEFERLLDSLSSGAGANVRSVTVFYLKHAKATAMAEMLNQILAGGIVSADMSSGGFQGRAGRGGGQGGQGGGPSGAASSPAQFGASRVAPTGRIAITPDDRLNALMVQANPNDLDMVEQLLKVLDQNRSPEEVTVVPKPRMIPVHNSDAAELAGVVRQVYADRMIESPTNRQMNPMMQMMMGRNGGQNAGQDGQFQPGNTGAGRQANNVAKLAVGVDARTNSLIVSAPDPLFEEVRQLVEELDVSAGNKDETVRVVTLHKTSPNAVGQALTAMIGDAAHITHNGANATDNMNQGSQFPTGGLPNGGMMRGFGGGGVQALQQALMGQGGMQGFGGGGGGRGGRGGMRGGGAAQAYGGPGMQGGGGGRGAGGGRTGGRGGMRGGQGGGGQGGGGAPAGVGG